MKLLFFLIAVALHGGGSGQDGPVQDAAATPPVTDDASDSANPRAELVAEPQEPTGRFTTAVEVRPILQATKNSWVAVRDYDGQDLVYFTHLLAWRCGLLQVRYAINDGDEKAFDLPPCYENEAQPNAIKAEDGLIFVAYPRNHVQRIDVTVVYDDLLEEAVALDRLGMLLP